MRYYARKLEYGVCSLFERDVWCVERVANQRADPVHIATFRTLSAASRLLRILNESIEAEWHRAMQKADSTPAPEFTDDCTHQTVPPAEGPE